MPFATIAIATRNRKSDLRTTLASVRQQCMPVETIVIDDGSNDGTADLVRTEFPDVRLHSCKESRGYIVRRNDLAALAGGDVIFSIDDDAAFSSPHVVEQTLREFDHERIGAVAIPYINVRQDNKLREAAPTRDRPYVSSHFVGTAHAVRRDLFLGLGGYRDHLVHQGEESDFCLRMLAAGYVVASGTADPVHHFESPRRSFARMDYFGRRNDILFAWHNCPLQQLPRQAVASSLGGILFGLKVRRPLRMAYGLLGGYAGCLRYWSRRQPVPAWAFRLYRWLRKHEPAPFEDILGQLRPSGMGERPATRGPSTTQS